MSNDRNKYFNFILILCRWKVTKRIDLLEGQLVA